VPVIIANKSKLRGTVAIGQLNQETTVVEIGPANDDWMVEGYIDLSQIQSGDAVVVNEYVALDGGNYRLLYSATVTGPPTEPVVRFHTKTLLATMKYKVTVTQTAGTPRSVSYYFITETMGTV
jgi:hypothetical protein